MQQRQRTMRTNALEIEVQWGETLKVRQQLPGTTWRYVVTKKTISFGHYEEYPGVSAR